MTVEFFLGTHQPGWLRTSSVPLFVSDRRLRGYKTLPRATAPWALDSGGFTELSTHGSWDHGPTPRQYADRVRRYRDEVGQLLWAAPQDWMCEPWILSKTGRSLLDHQRRTVGNYLQLREIAPDLPFVPVLQGWRLDDYLVCVELYSKAGVDLAAAQVVGLGSVCRRQATNEAVTIIDALRAAGVERLHGFGFKVLGLRRCGHRLASADSMAWSIEARRTAPLPGCQHKNCANCHLYAHQWRRRVIASIPLHEAPTLFDYPTLCGGRS
ncbi:DUF7221 family queuine tRNA-ribosyltransferase-like protein [Kribbella sp. CA-294648]|uniref:deazapurine DNA modification protein DpdA family protein n=1 Tax=Kribbella sp. CA-294648 TaxID=3239948 RepID=UPI003D946FA4